MFFPIFIYLTARYGWAQLLFWWTLPADLFPCEKINQFFRPYFPLLLHLWSSFLNLFFKLTEFLIIFRCLIQPGFQTGQSRMLIGLRESGIRNHTRLKMLLSSSWKTLRYVHMIIFNVKLNLPKVFLIMDFAPCMRANLKLLRKSGGATSNSFWVRLLLPSWMHHLCVPSYMAQ